MTEPAAQPPGVEAPKRIWIDAAPNLIAGAMRPIYDTPPDADLPIRSVEYVRADLPRATAGHLNGTQLECDGSELRPDGTCAKCERINERITPRATAVDESLLTVLKAAANYICRAQSDHYGAETRDVIVKALTYEINRLEAPPRATGETTVEWQPIETAPRDGTEVLVTNYSMPDGFYSVTLAQWVAHRGVWWGRGHLPEYPTHWQPVPAPPRTATEAGNNQ